MRQCIQHAFLLAVLMFLPGCIATRSTLVDVRAPLPSTQVDAAYNTVVMTLLDAGYDLKLNDRILHAVATEYKKYTQVNGWPPFDFYLRVKALIRQAPDGSYEIAFTPTIKEQNRINAGAFTEHPLIIYSDTEKKDPFIDSNSRSQAFLAGEQEFQLLLRKIAQGLGLSYEQFRQQLQPKKVQGL